MSNRLADVARKVGVSEATVSRVLNEKPGVSESTRQAVLTALDVLGYERPTKLRGERAPARRARPAGAAEPDLPGLRRGRLGRPRPAGLHARPVHPDGRRRVRGRLCRPAAPAAGVGRRLRRRPVRPGRRAARPLPPPRRARPAHGPGQRRDRRARVSRACRATTRSRSSRRWATCSRSATRGSACSLGPRDHVPSRRKLERAQGAAPPRRASTSGPTTSPTPCTRSRPPRPPPTRLLAKGDHRDRLRQRPDGARRDPGGAPRRPARARRRVGRRLRRLGADELHGPAADDGPPADRPDGPDGHRAPDRPDRRDAPCRTTSSSSSRSSSSAARPGRRRPPSDRCREGACKPRSGSARLCCDSQSYRQSFVKFLHCSVGCVTLPRSCGAVAGRGTDDRTRSHVTDSASPTVTLAPRVAGVRARDRRRHRAPHLPDDPTWWRSAVIYQVYVRSFADGNGDGTGDLAGVRVAPAIPARPRRRCHLVHARGTSRRSPTAATTSPTTGRSIRPSARSTRPRRSSPRRSTLGIRTIIDVVPNHVSDRHPWFQAALAAGPGSPGARAVLVPARPRPGRRRAADRLAVRVQGRPTWTRTTNPDGTPGEWYLHLFTAEQPDLNWDHPDVRAEHEAILRFWFDRGAAGVRIDSAALLVKDPAMPEVPADPVPGAHPIHDRDELHDIYRGWRAVADSYPGRPRPRRRGLARRTPSGSPATSGRTSCTPPSTSTSWPGRGTPPACASRSTRRSRPTPRSARRRPGCSRTTTSPGPSPGTAAQDSSFAFARKRFGTPTRPRARATSGAGRGAPHRGPARLPLHLPGRRARPRRGRGPARPRSRTRCTPAPAASTPGATAAGSRCRGAATAAPFGFSPTDADESAVAHPAGPLGRPDRRAPGSRPGLDAAPVSRRAAASGGAEPGLGDGPFDVAAVRARTSSPSRGARLRQRHQPVRRRRCRCRPTRRSCLPARTSRTATSRPTRRSGCARTVPSRRSQRGGCPTTIADGARRRPPGPRVVAGHRHGPATHRGKQQRGDTRCGPPSDARRRS